MLAAAAIVTAFTSGCGGSFAADHGGELVNEEGQIAFTRATSLKGTNIESDVYAINVDGSKETRLTGTSGFDGMPAWSPDGQRIAFASGRDGNWEIYVMDADGAQQRRLTRTPEDEGVPAWSPDGGKIAYVVDPLVEPTIH